MRRVRKIQPSLKITEGQVQGAVVDMLVLDGWRALRTDPVSNKARATGFGEVGMPDYLFVRYRYPPPAANAHEEAQILWAEFKRPGEVPTAHQLVWHEKERARGALVMVFDSLESAREWYKESGLMRNRILS